MSTKIIAAILVSFIAGIMGFTYAGGAQIQEQVDAVYISIPSADSTTKKVVDSTKEIRNEFVAKKDTLKDKVFLLEQQQKRIKETQRQIDSILIMTITMNTMQFILQYPLQ